MMLASAKEQHPATSASPLSSKATLAPSAVGTEASGILRQDAAPPTSPSTQGPTGGFSYGRRGSPGKGKTTQTRFAFYSSSSMYQNDALMNPSQITEFEPTSSSSGDDILKDLSEMGVMSQTGRKNQANADFKALQSISANSEETYDGDSTRKNPNTGEMKQLGGQMEQHDDGSERENMDQSEKGRQLIGKTAHPSNIIAASSNHAQDFPRSPYGHAGRRDGAHLPPTPPREVLPSHRMQQRHQIASDSSSDVLNAAPFLTSVPLTHHAQTQDASKSQTGNLLLNSALALTASDDAHLSTPARSEKQPTPKHRNFVTTNASDDAAKAASPHRKFHGLLPTSSRSGSSLLTPSRRHSPYNQQHQQRHLHSSPDAVTPSDDERGIEGGVFDESHSFEEAVRDALHILRRRVERLSELAALSPARAVMGMSASEDVESKPSDHQISASGLRPPPLPSLGSGVSTNRYIREGYALSPAQDVRRAPGTEGLFRRVGGSVESHKMESVSIEKGCRDENSKGSTEDVESPISSPKTTHGTNNDATTIATKTGQEETSFGSFPSSDDWRPDSLPTPVDRNNNISDGQESGKNFVSDVLDAVLGPIPSLPSPPSFPPSDSASGTTPANTSTELPATVKTTTKQNNHSSSGNLVASDDNNNTVTNDDDTDARVSRLRMEAEAMENRRRKLELERRWRQEEEVERGVERVLSAILARCNTAGGSAVGGIRTDLQINQNTTSAPRAGLHKSSVGVSSASASDSLQSAITTSEPVESAHDSAVLTASPPSIVGKGTWKTTSSGGLEVDLENHDDHGGDTIEEAFTKLGAALNINDGALLGDFSKDDDDDDRNNEENEIYDLNGLDDEDDADYDDEFNTRIVENRSSVVDELLAETEDEDDDIIIQNIATEPELTTRSGDSVFSREEELSVDVISPLISTSQTSMSSVHHSDSESISLSPSHKQYKISKAETDETVGENDHHRAPQVIPYSTSSDGMVGVEAIHMNESLVAGDTFHSHNANVRSVSSKVLGPLNRTVGGRTGVVLNESTENSFEVSAGDSSGVTAAKDLGPKQTISGQLSTNQLEAIESKGSMLSIGQKGSTSSPNILASLSEVVRKAPNNIMAVLSNTSGQETSSDDDDEPRNTGTCSNSRDSGVFPADAACVGAASGIVGHVFEDREAAALMRRLCAHLLPHDKDQVRTNKSSPSPSNSRSTFSRWLACDTNSFEGTEAYPSWDQDDPDEAGYVVHRINKSSLRRVEREFQKMANVLKKSSDVDLLRRDTPGDDKKTERKHEIEKKLEKAAVDDSERAEDEFERELQEGEALLNRKQKRHKDGERRKDDASDDSSSSCYEDDDDGDESSADDGGDDDSESNESLSSESQPNSKRRGERAKFEKQQSVDRSSRLDKKSSQGGGEPRVANPNFPHVRSSGGGKVGELELFHLPIIYKAHQTGFEAHKDLTLESGSVFAGQYLVQNELGSAAFSTAYRCIDLSSGQIGEDGEEYHDEVCLKVIKNTKDFFDQSLDEIKILEMLRRTGKCQRNNIVEMKTFFYHREHLVIVTELLRQNLFEFGRFILDNDEPTYFTRQRLCYITRQVLIALAFVHKLGLVHSDIKPENILLSSYSKARVKVIDFGSSCFLTDRQSSYIQSRSYRAPEVVLGLPYDGRIDIWSLGCVVAEMYTGQVTFQNDSVVSMLSRIEAICGAFPRHMIANGRQAKHFFTTSGLLYERLDGDEESNGTKRTPSSVLDLDDEDTSGTGDKRDETYYNIYQPKTTTFAERLGFDPELMKKKPTNFDDAGRVKFIDFIRCLLTVDPERRPTAEEALKHPWISSGLKLTETDIKYPPE